MLKTSSIAALCGLFLATPLLSHAECPAIGVPVIVDQTGDVFATMEVPENPDVAYNDSLYLDSPTDQFSGVIFNNRTNSPGDRKYLGTYPAGTELVFRLNAKTPSGGEFNLYSGSESRNSDGKPHAALSISDAGDTVVEFEDLLGNAECPNRIGAFTDFKFSLSNVKSILSPDRFLSYRTKPTAVAKTSVALTDEAGNGSFNVTVTKKASLANPAAIGATPIVSADPSLAGYVVKGPKRKSTFTVTNELGTWRIATLKAERLLIPTSTDLGSTPGLPTLDNQGIVDAYTCYKSKVVSGSKKLSSKPKLQDELNTVQREFTVTKPTRLCLPADQGSGVLRSDTYLMCYAAKPTKGKPKRVAGIHTNNASFGQSQTNVLKEEEYCVPSSASKL